MSQGISQTRSLSRLALAGLAAMVCSSAPLVARGQSSPSSAKESAQKPAAQPDGDPRQRARVLFVEGKKLFEAKNFRAAAVKFEEAYRISNIPVLLYNVGHTHEEMGNHELAVYYYTRFLAEADTGLGVYREVQERATALMKDGFVARKPTERKVARGGAAGMTSKNRDLVHRPINRAPPGVAIDVTVAVPAGVEWRVELFYRAEGKSLFAKTAMKPRYSDLAGRIPAATTGTKTVHYYVEARDSKGVVVARSGRSTSPNLVLIDPEASPSYYPDLDQRYGAQHGLGWAAGAGDLASPPVASDRPMAPISGAGRDSGFRDRPDGSWRLGIAKWGTTGATAVFVGSFVGFYLAAGNEASTLRDEAAASATECDRPPCRSFSDFQQDRESRGQRFETLARVSLLLGLASAGTAGYLWYLDLTGRGADESGRSRVTAVPFVDSNLVGGVATWRF